MVMLWGKHSMKCGAGNMEKGIMTELPQRMGFSGNGRLFTEPEKKKVFGKIGVHNAVVGILP
ncbi:hypothetical protein SI90_00845 [Akkermansia muciniphila]|nr:hypothetical protein SI90_00845 [Akkermansia muciniphila]